MCESDCFRTCQTSKEVLKLANNKLRVLSGVLKLELDSPEPLRAGAVCQRNASGGRQIFLEVEETLCIRSEVGEVMITVTDAEGKIITRPTPPPRTVEITQLAADDTAVEKAMRLYAELNHKSWVDMYRIHEVIEDDVGGQHALQKRRWGSIPDLERFKHSANSVTVAGDSARHGKEVGQPPKNPMSIDEAAGYLKNVLQSWLASKGA